MYLLWAVADCFDDDYGGDGDHDDDGGLGTVVNYDIVGYDDDLVVISGDEDGRAVMRNPKRLYSSGCLNLDPN